MNARLRHLLDHLRRLTEAGQNTPFPSRLTDALADRSGLAFAEVVRAALAGARAAGLGRPVPRGPWPDDPQPATSDCHCPTWRQLGDALAAAALAADRCPNGRPVAAVADLIARSQPYDPNA
jgi:hypothetical protein